MKNFKILFLVFLTLIVSCKGKTEKTNHEHMDHSAHEDAHGNQTKLVQSGDIQVAFDLMKMEYHVQMMEQMKVEMKHLEGATHGLMITVMDNNTKKTIQNAQVDITVIDPDGSKKTSESEIMSGMGMHHYAIHLKIKPESTYKIAAKISVNGKIHNVATEFNI